MPDTKITALTALTAADPANDVLPIVDVSDTTMAASGTTKKISINNVLGASGTATLASATITGDLTVDTSTLKVDSANNRVGVNTASPATDLEVRANGNAEGTIRLYSAIDGSTASPKGSYFSFRSGTGSGTETARLSSLNRFANVLGGDFSISTADTSSVLQNRLTIDSGGVFTFAVGGSTAMTLNSTGLGVGVASPDQKFCVLVADSAQAASFRAASGRLRIRPYINAAYGSAIQATNVAESALQLLTLEGYSINLNTNVGTAMTLDSSGNVGISRASTGNKLEAPGVGIDGRASVGGVSTVATTIYTIKQSSTAAMCVVFGDDGSNGFCDIVLFLATVAPKVVSSQTLYGSPAARTYSTSTTNLQLALASGTLSIRTAALSTLNT